MSERITFLPWLRGGLGQSLGERDTGQTSTARGAELTAEVLLENADDPATRVITLKSPDQAASIDVTQIARRYPAPGVADAEFGYFPHVEFVAPGLPWVLSPFTADEAAQASGSTGKLRPWLVLVCVEEAASTFFTRATAPVEQLTVDAGLLPDIAECWAWAHVQAPAGADIVELAARRSGQVISRLVAPRQLLPNRAYKCALVNAWRREGDTLVPAWDAGGGMVTLDVFDSWRFTTGQVGSFEELCERLGPVPAGRLTLGVNPMDVSHLGLFDVDGVEEGQTVDFTGALLDEDVPIEVLEPDQATDYVTQITDMVNQGTSRRVIAPKDPDPVVAPPLYGSWSTGLDTLPGEGWMTALNQRLRRRAAAGLGAQIIRENQDRFMALAWDQVGQLREVNRELSRIRSQAEQGRSWKTKAAQLPDFGVLGLLRPQATFARTKLGQPLRVALAQSALPGGALSPAFTRMMRPSGVAAKTLRGVGMRVQAPGQEIPFVDRAGWRDTMAKDVTSGKMRTGQPRKPVGMQTHDYRRDMANGATAPDPGTIPDILEPISLDPGISVSDAAALTLDAIRPIKTAKDRMLGRAPALQAFIADSPDSVLPPKITTGPVIDEALMWLLMEKSRDLLSPGITDFPNNAVRLLDADAGFVAAFMAGANHEFTRELLWREFPADLGFTSFQRFWDRPDTSVVDIAPIDQWVIKDTLKNQGKAGGETAVLLIRGDLIRQYPNVRIYLKEPDIEDTPGTVHFPSFAGTISPDIRFLGFDVADREAITDPPSDDKTWSIVIEEQPTEPRFGLDLDGPEVLKTYSELSWIHTADPKAAWLQVSDQDAIADNEYLSEEATWGLNGAHMAFATWQQPFRRVFRATDLLREPSP
ncbi:MAG: hypothetical protein AAFY25_11645 [Pseudomonadota bacterium]